jgi:hypothetical protein
MSCAGTTTTVAAVAQASASHSDATDQGLNITNNNIGGDSHICQWDECNERFSDPEQLYVSASDVFMCTGVSTFYQL